MKALIQTIIDKKSINIYMQKIVSHNDAFPLGVESFIKGIHPETGETISPKQLFEMAKETNLSIELDLMLVHEILSIFSVIYKEAPDTILFININEYLIKSHDSQQNLLAITKEYQIPTTNIAFDIADNTSVSPEEVLNFINNYRQHGFYISLDDIGKSYFNLDRIMLFNPDMIKINRQYMTNLNQPRYTHRLQNHTGRIAHDMGMVLIETGIEQEEELELAYNNDVQYFQGYHLHKPTLVTPTTVLGLLDIKDQQLLIDPYIKDAVIEDMRPFMSKMIVYLNQITYNSKSWEFDQLNDYIYELFEQYPSIENGWVINQDGIQITDALINNDSFSKRNASIFRIHDKDYDYSNEDFYRLLSSGALEVWITKPYLSLLSNGVCVTTSSYLRIEGSDPMILCLVFNYDMFRKKYM